MKDGDIDYMLGLECPQCHQSTELLVQSTTLIRMTNDDLKVVDGQFKLFENSPTACPACKYQGPFEAFQLDRDFSEPIHIADMDISSTLH